MVTDRQIKMSLDNFIKDPRNQTLVRAARIGSGLGLLLAAAGLIAAAYFWEKTSTTDMVLCVFFGSMGMLMLISKTVSFFQRKAG
jgi:Mg/Co/Ni transporter MgtE